MLGGVPLGPLDLLEEGNAEFKPFSWGVLTLWWDMVCVLSQD